MARSAFDAREIDTNLGWWTGGTRDCCPARREHVDENLFEAVRPPTEKRLEVVVVRVVHERCCGLDVHKRNVVACVLTSEGEEVRTFGTMTRELLDLLDWLQDRGVTSLAMESTGVYWKPVYNLLEGHGIELMVVNPGHMKAVPGRKTDVKDAAPGQPDSRAASAGVAGVHPLPAESGGDARGRGAPAAEGAGGRQHQAG